MSKLNECLNCKEKVLGVLVQSLEMHESSCFLRIVFFKICFPDKCNSSMNGGTKEPKEIRVFMLFLFQLSRDFLL